MDSVSVGSKGWCPSPVSSLRAGNRWNLRQRFIYRLHKVINRFTEMFLMLSRHSRSPRWYLSIPSELELTEVDPRQGLRRQLGCDPKKLFASKRISKLFRFFPPFKSFPLMLEKNSLVNRLHSLLLFHSFNRILMKPSGLCYKNLEQVYNEICF